MPQELEFQLTLYPSPVLRKVAKEVDPAEPELKATIDAMFALMERSEGVGLAAPQVGLGKRILVVNATGEPEDALALVNPVLLDRSGPESTFEEGCLSFPGIYAEVRRPERCTVEALDADGAPLKREFDGFTSRIIQHEYDHLEGVLLVDRMSPADKLRHKAALQELVEEYKAARGTLARRR